MRKIAMLAAVVAAPITAASAAEIAAGSKVDAVTVYPDGASVTRVVQTTLPAGDTTLVLGDFPPTLDPASVRIEGAGAVTIGSIDARPPRADKPAANPELERRLEKLRDERATLDDAIAAATARRKFAERFAAEVPFGPGAKAEATRPIGEWRSAFAGVADEIAAADAKIREAKLQQRDLDREIVKVEAAMRGNPPRKMEVRVDLTAASGGDTTLRITYSMPNARWSPLYDARLDSGGKDSKPTIEIVRRAEIVQQTGEDWRDVTLAVSTVRAAKGGSAPELMTVVVRYPQEGRKSYRAPAPAPAAAPPPRPITGGASADERAQEQEAVADNSGFQAVFRVPGRVSVAANEGAKSLRLGSTKTEPELMVRAAPALDPTAFLEAAFKHAEDAPLLAGRVAVYRDGTFVGRALMPATPKEELVRLGFGADEKVKVARSVARKNEGTSGIISSSKVDEREFKITVRNGHARPMKVQIEDQLPVSEHQDVQVELMPATTPPTLKDVRDRRGVLAWVFDAQPSEQREIKLAWRVKWPNDKTIVYQPGS